ncbi:MAG TPA: hypothetical protein VK425_11640, partial [Acidimicrobiales bacterium]|nr:hypothetical protein [Acidimicrobiales bacterium]
QKSRRGRGRPAEGGRPAPVAVRGSAPAAAVTREATRQADAVDLTTSRTTPAVASTVAPGAGRRRENGKEDDRKEAARDRRETGQ